MAQSPILVLLPGLHGSARHFDRFVNKLRPQLPNWSILPVTLPQDGPQDAESLVERLTPRLPTTPFVLLAESFSGPTAMRLCQHPQLKALCLVSSFISAPHPLSFALLPLRPLLAIKPPKAAVRALLAGEDAEDDVVEAVRSEIETTPAATLAGRIRASMAPEESPICIPDSLPVLILLARNDRLIPWEVQAELERTIPSAEVHWIEGPHLLLQIAPEECATALVRFLGERILIETA